MTSEGICITGANAYQAGCLDSNGLIIVPPIRESVPTS